MSYLAMNEQTYIERSSGFTVEELRATRLLLWLPGLARIIIPRRRAA